MRAALLIACLAAWDAAAQDYSSGEDAYAARDWQAAETLWQEAAEAGSAEALLGLGNIYDFGLVGQPDPERAFDFYAQAAERGVMEAAFNVGVMRDSGVGTPRDVGTAAAWYAFAALGGHARAQYNLGLLFADGEGAMRNLDFATHWLRLAADRLPAAEVALGALAVAEAAPGAMAAPDVLGGLVFDLPEGPQLRVAWRGAPAPSDARYRVDVVRLAAGEFEPLGSAATTGSAASVDLPGRGRPFAWRVSQVSDGSYAAAPWRTREGGVLQDAPIGAVRFAFAPEDLRAEGLALRLGGAMARAGVIVSYHPMPDGPSESGVSYAYAQDESLASDVSDFVSNLDEAEARLVPDAGLAPGEVSVVLSFASPN